MGRSRGAHAARSNRRAGRLPARRAGGPLLGLLLLFAVLVVVARADHAGQPTVDRPAAAPAVSSAPATDGRPVAGDSPYAGVGTWLSRYRFTREFGGAAPPVTPAAVDAMADAGVRTLIATVPAGAAWRVALGRADSGPSLDVYGLTTDVPTRTNPRDFVYRNVGLRFVAVPVPNAPGIGDDVVALDGNGDGRAEFLVLNGAEDSTGPIQRIQLVFR